MTAPTPGDAADMVIIEAVEECLYMCLDGSCDGVRGLGAPCWDNLRLVLARDRHVQKMVMQAAIKHVIDDADERNLGQFAIFVSLTNAIYKGEVALTIEEDV